MAEQLARTRHLIATTAEWAAVNPFVLGSGEIGFEKKVDGSVWAKVGDGATAFASLEYVFRYGAGSQTLENLTITGLLSAVNIVGNIAGELYVQVKNDDTATLVKGTPFYVTGGVGNSGRLLIRKALASDPTKGPAIGLLAEELAQNGEGNGVLIGEIHGYDTSSFSVNQQLYVASAGGLTGTPPGSGYRQTVCRVARVSANNGSLVLSVSPVAANTANGVAGLDSNGRLSSSLLPVSPELSGTVKLSGSSFSLVQFVGAVSNTYTLDILAANEFVANSVINANTTVNLSNLDSLPTNYRWEGIFRFQYTSGTFSWFTDNSSYVKKWDGGSEIQPTSGETETIIIRVVGGQNFIELYSARGRS